MSKVHCVFFRKVTQIQNFDSNSILGEKKEREKSIDLDSNSGTYLSW